MKDGDAASYGRIVEHYEELLAQHGDSLHSVGWPKEQAARVRFGVMADLFRGAPEGWTLLDFGCGASHFYEHLAAQGRLPKTYTGLDMSEKFIRVSEKKFPDNKYICRDVLADPLPGPVADYAVANGLFTYKGGMDAAAMREHMRRMLAAIYPLCGVGMAFNVMSPYVDWRDETLFYEPVQSVMDFVAEHLSRHFVVRHDYGLFEYTVYVYRAPRGQ